MQRVAGIVEKTLPHVEGLEPAAILDRVEDLDRLDRIGRRAFGLQDGEATGGSVLVNIDLRRLMAEPVRLEPEPLAPEPRPVADV